MTLVEKKRDWEDVDPQIREKLETEYTGQQVVMGAPIRGTFHVPRNAWDVIPPGKLLRMMRQPTISFVKTMIEVTGATSVWDVDAEPGVPEEAVKLVEKIIKEIKTDLWRAFCHAATTAGFLACEKVFEFVQAKDLPSSNLESVDEYISLRKLHELLPENVSILMDARDGFKGIRVNAPFMVNLPPEKCVVFTHDRHADDLYGKAILLNVEQAFDLYDQGLRNLDAFEQRMRLPIYIMTYPMQMSLVDGKLIDNGTLSKQYMTEMFDKQVIALGRRPNTDPTLTTATDSDWKIEKLPGENMTGDFLAGFYYYDKLIVRGFGFPERALLEGI